MRRALFILLVLLVSCPFFSSDITGSNRIFSLGGTPNPGSSLTEKINLYSSSSGGSGTAAVSITVTGALMFIAGAVLLPVGASNFYYSGCGLGWWEDSKFDVRFLDNDNGWGYTGIYSGIAFMISGGVFLAAGLALFIAGVTLIRISNGRISMFMENIPEAEKASFGFAYKLDFKRNF